MKNSESWVVETQLVELLDFLEEFGVKTLDVFFAGFIA